MKQRFTKKVLLMSLVCGVVLAALSLFIRGGDQHFDAMGGCSGCVFGVAVLAAPAHTTSHRGFPLAMVYLDKDDDEPNTLYVGYSLADIVGDVAIGTVVVIAVLVLLPGTRALKPKPH